MTAPAAALVGISKRFAGRTVLSGLDLAVLPAETLAMLGATASGKTTALRILAGLESADSGEVQLAGQVTREPPETRGVGMVFQGLALWPHLSVRRHLQLAVPRGQTAASQAQAVREAAQRAGLADRLAARPHELSGGERQQLAIARALLGSPQVLLLDEPCAHLDEPLRHATATSLGQLSCQHGPAVIYVTHRVDEAMAVADRLLVLQHGRAVRVGTPRQVFEDPRTRFVAELVSGASVIPADAVRSTQPPGTLLAMRPDQLSLTHETLPAPWATGRVSACQYHGDRWTVSVQLQAGDHSVCVAVPAAEKPPAPGDKVSLEIRSDPATVSEDTPPQSH